MRSGAATPSGGVAHLESSQGILHDYRGAGTLPATVLRANVANQRLGSWELKKRALKKDLQVTLTIERWTTRRFRWPGSLRRQPRPHALLYLQFYRTKEELVAGFEFVLELGDQTFTMD